MRFESPDRIADLVNEWVAASRYAPKINGVEVEVSELDDDSRFLRVLIHVKHLKDFSDDDVDAITSSLEGAVSKEDDRFPSIRYAEP